ncbi:MAG: tRNA threonylcarbamoyladenosine dehydratase [Firmicutes bacterium]|nr:tRNA threonylcarbamoyladenosine dehydratase [Bacillota bacterium]
MERLKNSTVAVFGIGGVGSFCVEGLARAGVGKFILVDNDTINRSNINRQIHALEDTVGQFKTLCQKERILKINKDANVTTYEIFYLKETMDKADIKNCDYIVDAMDTISAKLTLIKYAKENGIKIISCMGTGNKFDNKAFKVADIFDTRVCPLCKVMRKELKAINIESLKVVYSEEEPKQFEKVKKDNAREIPASISFVPSVAGLIICGEVIKSLINY